MRQFIDLVEGKLLEVTSPHLDSPAFKAWFAGSKVVDGNGNPLPVFHGTLEDFKEFKFDSEKRRAYGLSRLGFWFDVDPETPSYFGSASLNYNGNVMTVYLSIKKPLYFVSEPLARMHQKKLDAMVANKNWRQFNDFVDSPQADRRDSFNHLVSTIEELSPSGKIKRGSPAYERLVAEFRNNTIAEGYDGICLKDTFADAGSRGGRLTDWWITFHANQVKSVTGNVGSFNSDSDDITQ